MPAIFYLRSQTEGLRVCGWLQSRWIHEDSCHVKGVLIILNYHLEKREVIVRVQFY